MKRATDILFTVCVLTACGCVSQQPAEPKQLMRHGYARYADRSPTDAAKVTSDEAKAILVAQTVGVDRLTGGGRGYTYSFPRVYEVFTVSDGWYVYFHGDQVDGKTAHVNLDWKVDKMIYEGPLSSVIAATQPSSTPK